MSTLNISLPEQIKDWITQQVDTGWYSSSSDYLRDLVRDDMRHKKQGARWLHNHLQPLIETPDELFVEVSAEDVKARMHKRIKGSI